MRAVLPGFFLWAEQNEWANYLHILLVLAIVVALWRVIHAMFSSPEASVLRKGLQKAQDSRGIIDVAKKQDTAEWKTVRKRMSKLTIQGKRECKRVLDVLEQIRNAILQHGTDKRVVDAVCMALRDLKAREHVLATDLSRLEALDKRLLRFDLSQNHDLQQNFQRLSEKQQAELKTWFVEEREKLGAEEAIGELASRAEAYAGQFDQCVDSACACLESGRTNDAAEWVGRAMEQEQQAAKLVEDIRKQEQMFLSLLGRQMAEFGAARK